MKDNKYNLNDIIYFVHGTQVIKGIIDELIIHYTQTKSIIKYIIRPYKLENFITIAEDKIYTNIEEPKQFVINDLKEKYTRDNLKRNYKEARTNMEKKYKKDIKEFDANLKLALNSIEKTDENAMNEMEASYQDSLLEITKDKMA